MNANRRKRIREAIEQIKEIYEDVDMIRDEEQDSMDSIPENLQYSQRYYDMEEYIASIEDALDSLERASDALDEID